MAHPQHPADTIESTGNILIKAYIDSTPRSFGGGNSTDFEYWYVEEITHV